MNCSQSVQWAGTLLCSSSQLLFQKWSFLEPCMCTHMFHHLQIIVTIYCSFGRELSVDTISRITSFFRPVWWEQALTGQPGQGSYFSNSPPPQKRSDSYQTDKLVWHCTTGKFRYWGPQNTQPHNTVSSKAFELLEEVQDLNNYQIHFLNSWWCDPLPV